MKNNSRLVVEYIYIFVLVTSIIMSSLFSIAWAQEHSLPLISTRGQFDLETGQLIGGHNSTDYKAVNIPDCPPEIAIVVHGFGLDDAKAAERFDRTLMSLNANNYKIPLIGFSWDSNTISLPFDFGWSAWFNAKSISKDNGPKLAQFILDYMDNCKNEDKESMIRLISHSLGARVILSSLDSLHNNNIWNNNNYKITSVHLLGAAVDNEEVSKNIQDILFDGTNIGTVKTNAYGNSIEQEVTDFYNLYSPNDNYLEPKLFMQIYPSYEFGDRALGQSGYQTLPYPISFSLPKNYVQIDVENEIPAICDADGDKKTDSPFTKGEPVSLGDNHIGYLGFRNATDNAKLVDDGSINIVVDNWNNVEPKIEQKTELTAICE
ncbi:MAG: alpha/beta hydrolase [Nitrososphaeraceae archaeon]